MGMEGGKGGLGPREKLVNWGGETSQLGKVKELWRWTVMEAALCAQHNRAVHNHKDGAF